MAMRFRKTVVLFTSSKIIWKVLFFTWRNTFLSSNMNESYEMMRYFQEKFRIDEYKQKIRIDLKVVAIFIRLNIQRITVLFRNGTIKTEKIILIRNVGTKGNSVLQSRSMSKILYPMIYSYQLYISNFDHNF